MYEKLRTAGVVKDEKYDERGWNEPELPKEGTKPIPLPISEEEYKIFALSLASLALKDNNPKLCGLYFELQNRAFYGNRYSIEGMDEIEQQMWNIGTGEVVESNEKHR